MTDQTRWGIDMVQQKNKQKTYKEQKEVRDDIAFFVFNCNGFQLNKMKLYSLITDVIIGISFLFFLPVLFI